MKRHWLQKHAFQAARPGTACYRKPPHFVITKRFHPRHIFRSPGLNHVSRSIPCPFHTREDSGWKALIFVFHDRPGARDPHKPSLMNLSMTQLGAARAVLQPKKRPPPLASLQRQNGCIGPFFRAYSVMRARFWLIISVSFNLFLAARLYVAPRSLKEPAVSVPAVIDNVVLKTNVLVRRENFTWGDVQSTNYAALIKNLRAIGCPEQTIRDLITSDVNRTFARRRVTEVDYPNYQWWKSTPDPELAQAAAEKIQTLEKERHDLLTGLLGVGWDVEGKELIAARAGITLTGPILGDLPAQTKQTVLGIVAAAQLKIEAYLEEQRLQGKAIDSMQMVRLREEPLVALTSLLAPDAYDEFVLRYSPAAQQLREMMRTIDLTPDQFRALFAALSGIIGQPVFFYAGSDAALLKQQQQLVTQSQAVIKTTLGAAVYGNYQLNQDPLYRASQAMASQLNLPAGVVLPIYQIDRATQTEMDRIRNDDTLSNDEKVAALAQTQVQQEQTLEQLLGPDAFERWLQAQGQK
jgi:hypothetical protein